MDAARALDFWALNAFTISTLSIHSFNRLPEKKDPQNAWVVEWELGANMKILIISYQLHNAYKLLLWFLMDLNLAHIWTVKIFYRGLL